MTKPIPRKFIDKYCKEKQWSPSKLKFEQLQELREAYDKHVSQTEFKRAMKALEKKQSQK